MLTKNSYHQLITVKAIPEFKELAPCDASAIVETARKSKDLRPFQNWLIIAIAFGYAFFFFGNTFISKYLSLSFVMNMLLISLCVMIVSPVLHYVYLLTLRPQILLELATLKK